MKLNAAKIGFGFGALGIVLFAASEFVPELLWPCAGAFWAGLVCLILAMFNGSTDDVEADQ